ncbi:YccS/YhfK family membrane protein, partial [Leclercia adecarboxylata]
CFSIAAVAVELMFPYPWLFVAGLALSTFALVMLGALGERYGAIAQATLILAIYSMIAADQRSGELQHFWRDPLLLIAGAAWYLSLIPIRRCRPPYAPRVQLSADYLSKKK